MQSARVQRVVLKIVPDGVTSSQSDPLRDWSVLLLGSRQLLLRTEGLVALQFKRIVSLLPFFELRHRLCSHSGPIAPSSFSIPKSDNYV